MSRKPSFEDALKEKLDELPLPDENASWQQMNALLDKKEKRRGVFFFLNGKVLGGALLLCALLGGWLLFSTQTKKGSDRLVIDKEVKTAPARNADSGKAGIDVRQETYSKPNPATSVHHDTASAGSVNTISSSSSLATNHFSLSGKNKSALLRQWENESGKQSFAHQSVKKKTLKNTLQQTDDFSLQTGNNRITDSATAKQNQPAFDAHSSLQTAGAATSINTSSSSVSNSNQSVTTTNNNLPKIDSASANTATKATIKMKPRSTWFVDAGMGIKQQVPIDKQQFASCNYNGNRSWLGDYIPFFYARLEKENKWFVQGEFHYAAPRLIKGITYWQQTKVDYSHGIADKDIYQLQKTWYHEVPLSLNVYLRRHWSVGAGAMYSVLYGAAANKATSTYDAASGRYTDNSIQLHWRGYTDSFLYKNNTSLLLQTGYQLGRWSAGIRYLHDLHPFVTYTLPDGSRKDVRNSSLEMMIRYRFYRSHKFRIGNL